MTECTKWNLLFCSFYFPNSVVKCWSVYHLLDRWLPCAVPQRLSLVGSQRNQTVWNKRQSKLLPKEETFQKFEDAMHWLLVMNTSGIEADWVKIRLCKRHKGCPWVSSQFCWKQKYSVVGNITKNRQHHDQCSGCGCQKANAYILYWSCWDFVYNFDHC